MCRLSCSGHRRVARSGQDKALKASKRRSPLRDEVSRSNCCIGSWKTTRSIGRACTAGDRLSRPVLTAKQLDHPDRLSAARTSAPAARAIRWPHRFDPDDRRTVTNGKCQITKGWFWFLRKCHYFRCGVKPLCL